MPKYFSTYCANLMDGQISALRHWAKGRAREAASRSQSQHAVTAQLPAHGGGELKTINGRVLPGYRDARPSIVGQDDDAPVR